MLVNLVPDSGEQKLVGKMVQKAKHMKREVAAKSPHLIKHGIMVRSGLGGLSAARLLSDYFDEVMILDGDELPGDAIRRSGFMEHGFAKLAAAVALATFAVPNLTFAQHYTQTNLISDLPGMAAQTDPNLKNSW
jgi:hypothetical protein